MVNWKERFRAAGIHIGICLGVALLAGLVVFGLWYPYPYREISGGRELFLLVVAVDVVLGPLLTLAIFDRAKPWTVLRRDLAAIAMLQLGGLGYGMWTVFEARPVHLVFEVNRFRVVHAAEVPRELLDQTPAGITALPLWRPTLLSLRPFKDGTEKWNLALAEMGGVPIAARPDVWQSYAAGQADVRKAAKPVAELSSRFANSAADIGRTVAATGLSADRLGYLPLIGRKSYWTVFVDLQTAQPIAFLPLDSF